MKDDDDVPLAHSKKYKANTVKLRLQNVNDWIFLTIFSIDSISIVLTVLADISKVNMI